MMRTAIPPVTKGLLVLSLTLSIAVAAIRYAAYFRLTEEQPDRRIQMDRIYVGYLTVVPAVSVVFPWTFVVATLVEQNVLSLMVSLGTVFYAGKYCERVWGPAELARFVLIVAALPNLAVFMVYVIAYFVTGNEAYDFVQICGGVAVQAAFLVAFKQMVPEHTVILFRGIVKMRVKHLPAIFLVVYTVFGVLGARVSCLLTWAGFLTSWVYLRFFRVSSSLDILPSPATATPGTPAVTIRGDASDVFSFAHFFPDPLVPLVSPLCARAYDLLVKLHVCVPFSAEDIEGANARTGQFRQRIVGPLPGSVRAEAERRRAVALKALDQRMQSRPAAAPATGSTNYTPETN
ncbi:eukaryotic integral membrane protein-domain-containing protein [Dipodascopsis tothii]|uniref:eukaryotic integral membrane protein-domain-containing protein n=1 Tax=Dipodascopsis tothii TaxID=44089 RepID=UPI0034CFA3D1